VSLLRALAAMLLLSAFMAPAAARHSQPLDDAWRFMRADVTGAEATDFDDSGWTAATLPHTFNAVDGEAGGAYYRGPAWYRRTLDLSAGPQRRFIEFDGAALVADVWLNGRHAGRHEGGYARFRLDVTELAHAGRNTLAVRVDNSTTPTVAPLGGDFTVFGGLYRGVRLVETAPVHIGLLDHGGPGVSVAGEVLPSASARLRVSAQLRNELDVSRQVVLRLTLRDAKGRTVLGKRQPMTLAAHADAAVNASLQLANPHLWQGVADPYLYRLTVELLQGDDVLDAIQLPVGFRTVALDPARGFLLNGKPYALHGVNYFHPGRPGHGLAVGDAEIDEDFRILKELGVTALRLVHFQHPQRVYERADELGLVLWTEIPLNAAMDEGERFRANLGQQLSELIQQNRQHASVAIWGLGNEVYRSDEPVRALLASLHAQARREDPQRLTAYAHCCAPDDHPMALQTDLTGYNRYWGWYDGALTDIGPWADALHARLPTRAIAISEYGAGASALQQQDPPQRPKPGGSWHPEQYQALFHEAYWAQIHARPWLAGSFVWLAFDHASAGRNEGDKPGVNDKGLVSYDRKLLKDAYHLYRANWSREPMVHITSPRFSPRPAGPTPVKVYTNAERVTLEVNGVALASKTPVDRIATWQDVPLVAGRNVLSVRTEAGVTDTVTWEGT